MANRIFVAAVVVLWLGSMSWLLVDKVLPTYADGEPPIASGFETNVPVAWSVSWSGRPVGFAASVRSPGPQNTTNLDSRVVLDDVPLMDLVPALMRQVVGDIGRMKLDAKTHLEFDSLDNFSAFRSTVSINDISSLLQLNGRVNGGFLELNVKFNDVTYSPHVPLPNQSALNESLFPDAKMPYMYVGRKWHEETYSPFRTPSDPVDTVEVEVTGVESLERDDQLERVMRVEFRGSEESGIPEDARLQAVAWVRADDGLVLRQDLYISSSSLRFERLSDEKAAEVGRDLLTPPRPRRRGMGGPGRWGRGQWQPPAQNGPNDAATPNYEEAPLEFLPGDGSTRAE
jgi:hypothetical protein